MTLLAALVERDCVLVAADGCSTDTQIESPSLGHCSQATMPTEKLRQVPGRPLMWGSVGVTSPMDDFGDWLAMQKTTNWRALETIVTSQVASLNGAIQASFRASFGPGSNPPRVPGFGFGVMIAGYLGTAPGIVLINEYGLSDRIEGQQAHFFGPFTATARVAWAAVHKFVPDLAHEPATLGDFMSVICDTIPELTLPIHVWRISPEDGCIRW
jgi:hypothetical protein